MGLERVAGPGHRVLWAISYLAVGTEGRASASLVGYLVEQSWREPIQR